MTNLEEVERAMKYAKDRRMYERYQALYLHLKGYLPEAIADIQNRHIKTIKKHIKLYESGGLDALAIHYSPGAPVRLTEEQLDKLKHLVQNSSPREGGYSGRRWTLKALSDCIEHEFGHRYSLRGVSKLMQRLGLERMRNRNA